MSEYLDFDRLLDVFRLHWMSTLFLVFTVLTILFFLAVRCWFRRRMKRVMDEQRAEENELDLLPSVTPMDKDALVVIKRFRREVWDLPEADLQLGMEPLYRRAFDLVREVAAIYHPEIDSPQYEASLVELLNLVRRVTTRLSNLSGTTPFKYFGSRKISDYQRYYTMYRKINDNPIVHAIKSPRLRSVVRWAWNLKNIANPVYWAGKELSREGYFFGVRWFIITYLGQVGREAMRVYSGRHYQTEEERDAALICYRLFALARQWGGPTAEEWAFIVEFVIGRAVLEADAKLHILSRCSEGRLPKDLPEQRLQSRSGLKAYHSGLKDLLDVDRHPAPIKKELIQRELAVEE